MTAFRITTLSSVFTNSGDAFNDDTAGADALIVDSGAYAITTNAAAIGARLNPTGAWTATINGSVYGATGVLLAGSAGVSTITVGATGSIEGGPAVMFYGFGIEVDSSAIIRNAGTITGGDVAIAIFVGATHTIVNTGRIICTTEAIWDLSGGAGSKDTVTNTNYIQGRVLLGLGDDKLSNLGINALIDGDVDLGDGNNSLVNSGVLGSVGSFAVAAGSGNDTITNSGDCVGAISLGGGNDLFTNFVINATTGVMKSGNIDRTVDLGAGNDTLLGGAGFEGVLDGNGSDSIRLGGGDDYYTATGASADSDGTDTINGGSGRDTYIASLATQKVRINLDILDHTDLFGGEPPIAKNTATGPDVASGGIKDVVINIENALGGSSDDIIFGSGAVNDLRGNGGNDNLYGLGGNDFIDAGSGLDYVIGGAGADTLTGGADADTFWYYNKGDSGITAATRDVIKDFEVGFDRINLHELTAGTLTYLNGDSHDTPAASFTGAAHQLRSYWAAGGVVFELDLNGDKKADMSLMINDATHALHITDGSFTA